MSETLEPQGVFVHIQRDEAETQSHSGIYWIAWTRRRNRPWTGIVLGVGPDVQLPEIREAVGKRVLFRTFTGERFLPEIGDEQAQLFVREDDILAVVED